VNEPTSHEQPLWPVWVLAFGGASAWFSDLLVRYYAVEAGWARTHEPWLVASGMVALAGAAACLLIGVRWLLGRRPRVSRAAEFVIASGAAMNAVFTFLIAMSLLQHLWVKGGR
jgi:hypothetical protein